MGSKGESVIRAGGKMITMLSKSVIPHEIIHRLCTIVYRFYVIHRVLCLYSTSPLPGCTIAVYMLLPPVLSATGM